MWHSTNTRSETINASGAYRLFLSSACLLAAATFAPVNDIIPHAKSQLPYLMALCLLAAAFCRLHSHYKALLLHLNLLLQAWHGAKNLPTRQTCQPRKLSLLLCEIKQVFDQAQYQQKMAAELHMQLSANRHAITRLHSQLSVSKEFKALIQAIGQVASQIDEHAAEMKSREHYQPAGMDALCEQSFNLQLLIAGIDLLQQRSGCLSVTKSINPTHIFSRILVPFSSALDVRNMKLSSAAWSENTTVRMPAQTLETLCWLVLMGCLRYAEDESELTLSCEPATDGSVTFITCLISELAPATMHTSERASFMEKKAKHQSAHMFAHTLEQSANMQIAQRLCEHYGGHVLIHPHSPTRCMIEIALPC